jgi:hypothetical protein
MFIETSYISLCQQSCTDLTPALIRSDPAHSRRFVNGSSQRPIDFLAGRHDDPRTLQQIVESLAGEELADWAIPSLAVSARHEEGVCEVAIEEDFKLEVVV